MRFIICRVRCICIVILYIGFVLCDEQGGDLQVHNTPGGDELHNSVGGGDSSGIRTVCPLTTPAYDHDDHILNYLYSVDHTLHEKANECHQTLALTRIEQLINVTDASQIHLAYVNYCNNISTLKSCIGRLDLDSKLCLNETQQLQFRLLCEFIVASMEIGCLEDGHDGVTYYEKVHSPSPGRMSVMEECKFKSVAQLYIPDENHSDVGMIREYRVLQGSKECLAKHKGREQDTLVNAGLFIWTELMDRMACSYTEDGTRVYCKNLVGIL